MARIVADTNVAISALMFGGLPRAFLELANMQVFTLVTSPTLLDELDEKLQGKFKVPAVDSAEIRLRLERISIVVHPDFVLHVIAEDPDDDRVLECAVAGKADYIVSGDRHLLKLGSFEDIQIATVRQYLDMAGIRA